MKPNHGKIKELSWFECKKLIDRNHFGHLGCHSKHEVYVVPVAYTIEGQSIYCHSNLGKKIEMMRAHPEVCLQIEEIDNYFSWRSVMIQGRFRELPEKNAESAMRLLIKRLVERESNPKHSSLEVDIAAQIERSIVYAIEIENITGRFESP